VNRRRGASEVVNLINFDIERESDVVAQEFEIGVCYQVPDIVFSPREEIINAKNVMALAQERVREVRTEEPSSTGNQYSLSQLWPFQLSGR
jgi:hypothetical protein